MKIKKLNLLVIPLAALMLAGCTQSQVPGTPGDADYSTLKILAPTGAPSVALYSFATSENFTTTTNPKTGLMPMFKTNNYDVIVAPTNGGLNQIVNQGANYKIAATITFGNFYVVSTGKDDDGVLDEGDTVLAFQETDVPGLVFKYVYSDLNLDFTWADDVSKTKVAIENGGSLKIDEVTTKEFDYIFTAQPVVAATNSTIFKNVQDDFKTKSGGKIITQASIFVNNNAAKDKVDALLAKIKSDIEEGLKDTTLFKTSIEQLGEVKEQQDKFGVPGAMAMKVANMNNGFSLGYKSAKEIKEEISSFVNLVTNNAIGELSEEVFY